jgi:transcriptional repressor NrdR
MESLSLSKWLWPQRLTFYIEGPFGRLCFRVRQLEAASARTLVNAFCVTEVQPGCRSRAGSLVLGSGFWCKFKQSADRRPVPVVPVPQPMTCPFCGFREDKVIDSRESKEGDSIRRRRQCLSCERRFTTYERCDEVPYMVIKKDGRRESFDRQKVLNGLLRACEKRPVSMGSLASLVGEIESELLETPDRELSTTVIGERLMERLKALDKIAYVRFASVYRDFQDIEDFFGELKDVMLHRKV